MKKSLLILAISVIASVNNFKAQTTWDFSSAAWPVIAGETVATVKNNIALVPGPPSVVNFAQVEANSATFEDGYTASKRFKLNGGGFTSTGVNTTPTQRYIYFKTNGNSTIKIWYKNGGGGDRTLYIGTGTAILTSKTYSNSQDGIIFTYEYVGPAANIYIYGDQSLNIYKITAANVGTTVLGVNDVKKELKANVFSSGNKVYVSNLDAKNTQVSILSANGSLVRSANISADSNFEVNAKGVYFVNLKSEAGEKSVKVLLK
ncbi:T9SS type A sorting domain-containing protein [Epilithonimonas mollis]|uniref:Por secretion system C-terminal sorting domain-containing protein n=1 Tax=Epilithonimonas mollis TaxID=216903 RepID=A0A1M6NFK3_9FLAO|nr:T9SS type A sorting domain-containing protein [Epilithonimonas mollis]SHJ94480.1 Por secretion system C-terminal sorting domain-containing protein [Epilithonimonas mollis]